MAERNIYLKNKDLLREIHKSKCNFSEFIDKKYQNYDIIFDSKDNCLTDDGKNKAKQNKFDKLRKSGEQIYDSIDDIKDEELIFRVYTYEHIPLDPTRKKKIKKESDKHTKVNFIPFKHYIIQNNDLVEVGRSHSKNGEFSMDAQITDTLARMYILMIERYSERYNWRGYCVDENTEALTKRGWLKYNEITENDTILSYENGDMKWSKIESIFRDDYDGLMFKMDSKGIDALVTPGHKIVTKDGLKRIDYMLESDQIVILGDELKTDSDYTGTDLCIEDLSRDEINMDLIHSLTNKQKKILIKKIESFGDDFIDIYQALLAITGICVTKEENVSDINFHGSISDVYDIENKFQYPNKPTYQYKGKVWCPVTEYGCFVARRNGKVYLTGNSYVDEMKGQALLQLIQVGLQFNEMKSNNPFSYYTACLYNSFLKMLEIEKRNQNIRDDLLIKAGQNPSFTKQLEHDEHIRKMRDEINDNGEIW